MTLFQPSVNLRTSLLGVADPTKFVDPIRTESQVYESGLSEGLEGRVRLGKKQHPIKYTIIIILVSAVIFVTAVALYDVIRHIINNYYAKQVLIDLGEEDEETVRGIDRTLAANRGTLIASGIFALFCVVIAIILVPLLLWLL